MSYQLRYDGSPPHTRGKYYIKKREIPAKRITPAYAGKMRRTQAAIRCRADHPRIRGENASLPQGFPPHSWITPAYAGKILGSAITALGNTDHPRIRGEN